MEDGWDKVWHGGNGVATLVFMDGGCWSAREGKDGVERSSASLATFESFECMQMVKYTRTVAILVASLSHRQGRPNSGPLKRYIQAHCHSARKTRIFIRYRSGII